MLYRTLQIAVAFSAALGLVPPLKAGTIAVTDSGSPTAATCTLAQAINAANNVNIAPPGAADAGNCAPGTSGPNTVQLAEATYTFAAPDNWWYGPNALPTIQSDITIEGYGATLVASHAGDPTPSAAQAFRFFYVSGGLGGELPAGNLTLHKLTLRGGYARGGDGNGAGAGMGGAIFNQGLLTLDSVTLQGNTARGGDTKFPVEGAAGGMGQDGTDSAGGFGIGWQTGFGGLGGKGAAGSLGSCIGGGGGGFIAGISDGEDSPGGAGGGYSWLGGDAGAPGGDGGGAGFIDNEFPISCGDGGAFGFGADLQGGGGVGGGGGFGGGGKSSFGAGGGFGGGGGAGGGVGGGSGGTGGFGGGGGGASLGGGAGGFGGGTSFSFTGGAGAGLGGAIFNHRGTVQLFNVTATANSAIGGTVPDPYSANGSGLGGAIFNLNGTVGIRFSTLFQNQVSGTNTTRGDTRIPPPYGGGPGDGTVYSLAYGNSIENGTRVEAELIIDESIVYGTDGENGAANHDVVNTEVDGRYTNMLRMDYGLNIIGSALPAPSPLDGVTPISSDPQLGALSPYAPTGSPATFPIGPNSPAHDAATSCNGANGVDERGVVRPQDSACDIGAYEYDGDYIFSNSFD